MKSDRKSSLTKGKKLDLAAPDSNAQTRSCTSYYITVTHMMEGLWGGMGWGRGVLAENDATVSMSWRCVVPHKYRSVTNMKTMF